MSQITFHHRPDGIFVEIPIGVFQREVRATEIQRAIESFFVSRERASLEALPLVDLLVKIANTDPAVDGLILETEELKRRVDGFSAHDRIRLGAVK